MHSINSSSFRNGDFIQLNNAPNDESSCESPRRRPLSMNNSRSLLTNKKYSAAKNGNDLKTEISIDDLLRQHCGASPLPEAPPRSRTVDSPAIIISRDESKTKPKITSKEQMLRQIKKEASIPSIPLEISIRSLSLCSSHDDDVSCLLPKTHDTNARSHSLLLDAAPTPPRRACTITKNDNEYSSRISTMEESEPDTSRMNVILTTNRNGVPLCNSNRYITTAAAPAEISLPTLSYPDHTSRSWSQLLESSSVPPPKKRKNMPKEILFLPTKEESNNDRHFGINGLQLRSNHDHDDRHNHRQHQFQHHLQRQPSMGNSCAELPPMRQRTKRLRSDARTKGEF